MMNVDNQPDHRPPAERSGEDASSRKPESDDYYQPPPGAVPELSIAKLNHPNPYWPLKASLIGVAYIAHLRYRRYAPRKLPTLTPLRLGELYGSFAAIYTIGQEQRWAKLRVVNDRDLLTLEAAGRRQRTRWQEIQELVYQRPEYAQPRFDRQMRAGDGFVAQVVWLRDHLWADEVAYNYFYRELYERYAQKYPEISQQDWDVLITHMANTAYSDADDRFIGMASPMLIPAVISAPMAMFARWKQMRFLTPLLNGLQRTSFYLWALSLAMQPYRHWAYPLTLQNKQRVAEMLREAYPGLEDDAQRLRIQYREC
ncbi:hypothetical protein FKP32DRAFT_1629808 [Trametes sanguinea]|nr:hypothetical protein FKP32DRAFT_1629808 [Trametes sanguinea]